MTLNIVYGDDMIKQKTQNNNHIVKDKLYVAPLKQDHLQQLLRGSQQYQQTNLTQKFADTQSYEKNPSKGILNNLNPEIFLPNLAYQSNIEQTSSKNGQNYFENRTASHNQVQSHGYQHISIPPSKPVFNNHNKIINLSADNSYESFMIFEDSFTKKTSNNTNKQIKSNLRYSGINNPTTTKGTSLLSRRNNKLQTEKISSTQEKIENIQQIKSHSYYQNNSGNAKIASSTNVNSSNRCSERSSVMSTNKHIYTATNDKKAYSWQINTRESTNRGSSQSNQTKTFESYIKHRNPKNQQNQNALSSEYLVSHGEKETTIEFEDEQSPQPQRLIHSSIEKKHQLVNKSQIAQQRTQKAIKDYDDKPQSIQGHAYQKFVRRSNKNSISNLNESQQNDSIPLVIDKVKVNRNIKRSYLDAPPIIIPLFNSIDSNNSYKMRDKFVKNNRKMKSFNITKQTNKSEIDSLQLVRTIQKDHYQKQGLESEIKEGKCQEELEQENSIKSRSQTPSDRSSYTRQQEVAKRLSNPFTPCRRSCTTVHHPLNHHLVVFPLGQNKSARNLHEPSPKRKVVIPEKRAVSQDSGLRKKQQDVYDLDWANSQLYYNIVQPKVEYDEQDELYHAQGEDPANIFSEIEVNYIASILKKKLHNKDIVPMDELKKIFDKAMNTLQYKMQTLLLIKAFEVIKEQYNQSNDKKESIQNCIKLLLRNKKMFEAIAQVTRILKKINQREKYKEKLLHTSDHDELIDIFDSILILSSRIIKDIIYLQDEHRNLKRPFIFKKSDYMEQMIYESEQFKNKIRDVCKLDINKTLLKDGTIQSENNDLS